MKDDYIIKGGVTIVFVSILVCVIGIYINITSKDAFTMEHKVPEECECKECEDYTILNEVIESQMMCKEEACFDTFTQWCSNRKMPVDWVMKDLKDCEFALERKCDSDRNKLIGTIIDCESNNQSLHTKAINLSKELDKYKQLDSCDVVREKLNTCDTAIGSALKEIDYVLENTK